MEGVRGDYIVSELGHGVFITDESYKIFEKTENFEDYEYDSRVCVKIERE